MSVRTYRRPFRFASQDGETWMVATTPPTPEYEEMFVVLEKPLLEFTRKGLIFLRERGIDPFWR